MRRLAGWTLNALTALSLLLCTAAVGVCARSYNRAWWWHFTYRGEQCRLIVWHGWVEVNNVPEWSSDLTALAKVAREQETLFLRGGAFTYDTVKRDDIESTESKRLTGLQNWLSAHLDAHPHWEHKSRWPMPVFAAATAVLPLWAARRTLRARRARIDGLCPGCGYDMRATPTKCPECGRAVEVAG